METNLPVWGYYPKDDRFFVDPLYAPYMRNLVRTNDGQVCEVNLTPKMGCPGGTIHPGLVRKGWGLNFQLLHPTDPCPESWTKDKESGWCFANEPEFGDHGLYSEDAFVPKYQYWNGYAPRLQNPRFRELTSFDQKSVSPWSGDYTQQYLPKPSSNRGVYGHLPSKDSYLA